MYSEQAMLGPEKSSTHRIVPVQIIFWLFFAGWVVSFFLPAYTGPGSFGGGTVTVYGRGAAIGSMLSFFRPVYGWAWIANVFMALSPFRVSGARHGKGQVYATLFIATALVGVACAFPPPKFSIPDVQTLQIGYFVWELSLLGTATWFLWSAFHRSILLLPGLILAYSLFYAPEHMLKLRSYRVIENMKAAIKALETPRGSPFSHYTTPFDNDWNLRVSFHEGYGEITAASQNLRDIEMCKHRERISDDWILLSYPHVIIHPPDPNHVPQPATEAIIVESYCNKDESAAKPWVLESDMERAALSEAKTHLDDAERILGIYVGSK